MSETENKKTATERLEILENTAQSIIQAIQPLANMAQDLMALREAVKLLNNKLDSTIGCLNAKEDLTDDNIGARMTANNAKDLQDKVTKMVNDGLLAATTTIGKDSFVVLNEQDSTGKIVNPRMQFLLSALQNEEVKTKLEGATVGSNIPVGDKGGSLNILEAYNIVAPQAPAAEADQAPAADATAPAAEASAAPAASDAAAPAAETATA
jgi:regulator of replication initiation timing